MLAMTGIILPPVSKWTFYKKTSDADSPKNSGEMTQQKEKQSRLWSHFSLKSFSFKWNSQLFTLLNYKVLELQTPHLTNGGIKYQILNS